jgi:nicotinamidase-related amidase
MTDGQRNGASGWWDRWGGALGERHEARLSPRRTALVVVDMQYLDAHRDFGIGARLKALGTQAAYAYYFDRVESLVIPNIQRLQRTCREQGIEVMFCRIASLVQDSRDVNFMQRRHGTMLAASTSKEAQILEELAPLENELVITKGCSGIFNGTAFDQICRNMGIDSLIFCGVATNYCVETAVRDAGDRGYEVIMVSDACAAITAEQERLAAEVLDGVYCRVLTTDDTIGAIDDAIAAVRVTPATR